jgi:hypothetical protein
MAKLVFGLNQSLDGYVDLDRQEFAPDSRLFRHFIEQVRNSTGSVYGRVGQRKDKIRLRDRVGGIAPVARVAGEQRRIA